jgi:hypothetical protein
MRGRAWFGVVLGALRRVELVVRPSGVSWMWLRCHGGASLLLPDVYEVPLTEVHDALVRGRQAYEHRAEGDASG